MESPPQLPVLPAAPAATGSRGAARQYHRGGAPGQRGSTNPRRNRPAALCPAKRSSAGRVATHLAFRCSSASPCTAVPACAGSLCARARRNAPQRRFDLRTRCFTKIITICMEVVCDKNKNIPKSVLRLRLRLRVFFHKDPPGFWFYLNPDLANTVPAHGFPRRRHSAGSRHPAATEEPSASGGDPPRCRAPYRPRASPHPFSAPPAARRARVLCPAPSAGTRTRSAQQNEGFRSAYAAPHP